VTLQPKTFSLNSPDLDWRFFCRAGMQIPPFLSFNQFMTLHANAGCSTMSAFAASQPTPLTASLPLLLTCLTLLSFCRDQPLPLLCRTSAQPLDIFLGCASSFELSLDTRRSHFRVLYRFPRDTIPCTVLHRRSVDTVFCHLWCLSFQGFRFGRLPSGLRHQTCSLPLLDQMSTPSALCNPRLTGMPGYLSVDFRAWPWTSRLPHLA